MALEDGVKVLKQEYLQLYDKFQHLKDLARIDLDLLSLSVDLENVPDAKVELDKVHELVHALMNEEVNLHFEELYEDDCQVVVMGDMNSIEHAQNIETDNMKLVEDTPVVKTENIYLEHETEDRTQESNASQNSENKFQFLDELLAQMTSNFTEQQIIDAFVRLTFSKVFIPPKTNQVVFDSQTDLHDTQTTQVSHCFELEETNDMDPVTESLDDDMQETSNAKVTHPESGARGKRKRSKGPKKTCSKKSVSPFNSSRQVESSTEKSEGAEERLAQTVHTIIIDDKTLDTPNLQPISLQNLITPGMAGIEKNDDEKRESAATVVPTEKIYECERCGVTLEDRNLFNQHRQIHAKEDNTCTVCGKQFTKKSGLKKHTQLHSSEKSFLCKICGKAFHTKDYLKTHADRHDNNKPKLYCEVCGKPFASWNSLSKHMISHRKENLKCSFCDKQCKNLDILSTHEKRHTEHFPHLCLKCGKRFKNPMQLSVHERIHIGKHKTFSSKTKHSARKQSHIPFNLYTPYNCSVCQEQFKGSRAMAQHMLTHPEELQFCILCQKTFDSPLDLKSHVIRTHFKTLKCSICGEHFSSGYRLINHKAYHKHADPFKCNICGKSFCSKPTLKLHRMSKHLKTKKYQCEYCGRNFYWQANFRRHVQNHKGLKPFKCSVCGIEFSQKTSLETHSWTHRADKRFNCENCGRGFNEKRALLSHMKTQHEDQQDGSGMNDLTMVLS